MLTSFARDLNRSFPHGRNLMRCRKFQRAQSAATWRRATAARGDRRKDLPGRVVGSRHRGMRRLPRSRCRRRRPNSSFGGSALSLRHRQIGQLGQRTRPKSNDTGHGGHHEPGCAQPQQVADRSGCGLCQLSEIASILHEGKVKLAFSCRGDRTRSLRLRVHARLPSDAAFHRPRKAPTLLEQHQLRTSS